MTALIIHAYGRLTLMRENWRHRQIVGDLELLVHLRQLQVQVSDRLRRRPAAVGGLDRRLAG